MRQIPTEGCGSDAGKAAWPRRGLTINSRRAEAGHVTAFALINGGFSRSSRRSCSRAGRRTVAAPGGYRRPRKAGDGPVSVHRRPRQDEFEILAGGHMEWIFQEEIIHRSVSTQLLFTLSSGPFEADFSSPHILT
ncbi:Myotubularin-Related Protein 1 [Manis pentadactyla]|nr:Myotubularin-Related Protein 1 [Manis pentadactyla]